MCMVAPNPCLFNKACALKRVNLAKFMDDRLAFVFGESRPKFSMKQDFYFYVLLQNDHQPFFFLFSRFFH